MGIQTHTISMDNYFNTIDPETAPRNREGNIDYESPFCLDIELLNRHFSIAGPGGDIHVPKYEFARQMRSDILSQPLKLGPDELAIFEGIHALNDIIVGKNPKAFKLYIAARSNVVDETRRVVFQHPWLRPVPPVVRDYKFRGSDANFTLKMWPNVRRGEKLYISPYKENADLMFDSSLPDEMAVLKPFVVPLLEALPRASTRSRTTSSGLYPHRVHGGVQHRPQLPGAGVHRRQHLSQLTQAGPRPAAPFLLRRSYSHE